jgi:hypothetical protein
VVEYSCHLPVKEISLVPANQYDKSTSKTAILNIQIKSLQQYVFVRVMLFLAQPFRYQDENG